MFSLQDREWKELFIGNLFEVKRPKPRSEKQYQQGKIPFIASGNMNNGVIKCCTPQNGECLDRGNCITVSPVDGSAFYQEFNFLGRGGAGSSILLLYNNNLNRYSGLFISRMIRQTCSIYCYGKMGNQESIKREKIMLPIDEHGNPDYSFMEQYIKERESQLIQKYKNFIGKNIQSGGVLTDLKSVKWKAFYINEIFSISAGKRLTKADMDSGQIPFIGATDSNNGITNWIATPNSSFDKNVLGVNYNGSVVENFYHPYCCVFSDDVKRLHLRKHADNKYILLFFKTVILQQKIKYTYGYKFNGQRMERQKILLPVNEEGHPDYEFMEQYGKQIMMQKYQQYLNYISART